MRQRCLVLTKPYWLGLTQSCRRTMVTVERTAVETVCDEYAVRQGVLGTGS